MKAKIKHTPKPSASPNDTQDFIRQKGGSTAPALHNKYATRLTENIKSAMRECVDTDPIAKQYIPQNSELKILPEENTDPIGDSAHTPVKGIVHRYPDRVLFKPANVCAVYCRYCFRREHVGPGSNILNEQEREAAFEYIRTHPEIWEVVLTGGDPLVLSARQLTEIMEALTTIEHVKVIRFHTRVPIADPKRINQNLINALTLHTNRSDSKAIYIALHINHANELTSETRKTIQSLHKAGINLLSQSVLLKGVNNDAKILADLYRELVSLNVKPYYLHHPDLAPGTSHFRLSIAEGQNIVNQLRGYLSGLCQPTYMLDIPGGYGKIPLTPCALTPLEEGGYIIKDFKGRTHTYTPEIEIQNKRNAQ